MHATVCPMKTALVCVVSLLLLVPAAIAVCMVPRPRLVCAEYFSSQVVVEATLVRMQTMRFKDDPEGVCFPLSRATVCT